MAYQEIQKKHPRFFYHHYQQSFIKRDLVLSFFYQLENGPEFTHQVIFRKIDLDLWKKQNSLLINNLIFNLGLIEMLSYWKLAACPEIVINCGQLGKKQVFFWQDLISRGMSEYFFINQIKEFFLKPPKLTIGHLSPTKALVAKKNSPEITYAANLGGGKDSVVLLASLKQAGCQFINLVIQPASPAAVKMGTLSGQPLYSIERIFDKKLTLLNQKNYLNGHVPFSASVAFINLLAALTYGFDCALVGNEKSADQISFKWEKNEINHQYSKSTKFEQDFEKYRSQFLVKNIKYYSLIRKLNEIEIAHIFSSIPNFFSIFRSCNRGQRNGLWCHRCAKCLFVFLILSPFIEEKVLAKQIFNHNLFEDLFLLKEFKKILGLAPNKPLECVGTIEESRLALYLTIKKYQQEKRSLPVLVQKVKNQFEKLNINWQEEESRLLRYNIDDLDWPKC